MKKFICKIFTQSEKGTGFFCYIKYKNFYIPVMITNHIINESNYKNHNRIKITINNGKEFRTIILDEKRIFYTSKDYDTSIIEIKPIIDRIYNFMELDDDLMKDNSNLYNNLPVYIIQYPKHDKAAVSYGIINEINNCNLNHLCSTKSGSSGSPILKLSNNKIIGVHKGGSGFDFNNGILLNYPIKEFIEQNCNKITEQNLKELSKKNDLINFYLKNSEIVKSKNDFLFIVSSLLKRINISNIKLLYKASVHGDTSQSFKNNCNNKGPTLTLIKSSNNEIFGGFTQYDWTNEDGMYSNDNKAFLYSITNQKIFYIIKPHRAIRNYRKNYAFVCFGNKNDWGGLYFFDGFLSHYQGYWNPKKRTKIYDIQDSKEFFSDNYFKVKEMEVYQIIS